MDLLAHACVALSVIAASIAAVLIVFETRPDSGARLFVHRSDYLRTRRPSVARGTFGVRA